MNSSPALGNEKVPVTTADTATLYRTSAVPSLTRLSPSRIVTIRRGTPRRSAMAVAATGSVGETMAPSTKATGHESPTAQCAIPATTSIVSTTRPTERSPMGRTLARRSRGEEKNADTYKSGGKKISNTSSGASSMSGMPGTKPKARPPMTRKMGYGTFVALASSTSPATATSSPKTMSSRCSTTPPPLPRRYRREAPSSLHPLSRRAAALRPTGPRKWRPFLVPRSSPTSDRVGLLPYPEHGLAGEAAVEHLPGHLARLCPGRLHAHMRTQPALLKETREPRKTLGRRLGQHLVKDYKAVQAGPAHEVKVLYVEGGLGGGWYPKRNAGPT